MLLCMCMLTKRTNILFDEKTWKDLIVIAQEKNMSVGELVRHAVMRVYLNSDAIILQQRKRALAQIKQTKKQIKHKFSSKEITELINYGRKY